MILLTMLLIPTLVALGFLVFGGRKVTFGEFIGQNVIQLAIMGTFIGVISWSNTHDVEVWNGKVASKTHYHVSCEHSYPCHPHSCMCDSKGNCSTCYDTCYDHSYDVDWVAVTSNNETIRIGRVDRQGLTMPLRWDTIQMGEPTAVTHGFTNYVKGAPDSLFRKQGLVEQYKDKIPAYPGSVFDYYHLNRLVTIGVVLQDASQWNADLENINANLGRTKQVNMIVVATKNLPEEFYYAVEQAWIGGKKNDFVTFINVDDSNKITWSKVMAWTDNKMAEVTVADAMVKLGTLDRTKVLEQISSGVNQFFVRKHMKDFEYLSHQVKPTLWQWIFAMILGLASSIGLGICFLNNDIEDGKRSQYGYRY